MEDESAPKEWARSTMAGYVYRDMGENSLDSDGLLKDLASE